MNQRAIDEEIEALKKQLKDLPDEKKRSLLLERFYGLQTGPLVWDQGSAIEVKQRIEQHFRL